MSQSNRTAAGGLIDRGRRLSFRFDGRSYTGHAGDTLASALLANDVHLIGRSFKYHRPRGILSAGAEEPNALVQLSAPDCSEPNVRATQLALYEGLEAQSQNRWPSLHLDLGALFDRCSAMLPAGFFYKTFMWPGSAWLRYEAPIRRMAGLGRAPQTRDPAVYDHMHAHCDVLVVGAGPAGLAAALAAGRAGARVILADDQPAAGGWLLGERAEIGGRPALAWVGAVVEELRGLAEVRILLRTPVTGYYDHNFLIGCEDLHAREAHGAGSRGPRQRLWKIRAREVVLATGAIERPLVFADNDRPGIMLASAVRTYLNRYGVKAGSRIVLASVCDDAYRTALDLASAGVPIVAVIDLRDQAMGYLPGQARARGIEVLAGHTVVATEGRMRISGVTVRSAAGGPHRELGCDLLAMSGGWMPNVQLFAQSRGRLAPDPSLGTFVPRDSPQPVRCVGAARGSYALREALAEGWEGGLQAAAACGFTLAVSAAIAHASEPTEAPAQRQRIDVSASRAKQFVDFQTDVTVDDIALAAREGYEFPEHLKRYTTAGMGVDQGKTGSLNVLETLAALRSIPLEALGPTTYRPPSQPLGFGAIAGLDVGELFDPVRTTPLHDWHLRNGATFEDVGQWKRARHYARPGESLRVAVDRECLAVRRALGIFDASTLGKIDIQGADAAEFLDRIYCNSFRSLAVGRCRYGLMLREDGMVFDDGVIARLAEHHYLVTTTTGGAGRVLAWLEDWLQTEWPQLRVHCTCVTEHYAQIALAGPHCIQALSPLADVKLDAMPYMSMREGRVAGIPARIFRISFSGALGYEVAVPASRARELWTTLIGAGERFGITAYGTEAMHVLRAELGYILVGQDTDGSVTPIDLGFDRLLSADKPFIGKRSLARPDLHRGDRKQLVGVLTEPADTVLREGAQLVAEPVDGRARQASPVAMLGHVTSSYYSAACGRSIALALVQAGISRLGEVLYAISDGEPVKVVLTAPRFLPAPKAADA